MAAQGTIYLLSSKLHTLEWHLQQRLGAKLRQQNMVRKFGQICFWFVWSFHLFRGRNQYIYSGIIIWMYLKSFSFVFHSWSATRSALRPLPLPPPWVPEHLDTPQCHLPYAPCHAGCHPALHSSTSAIPAGERKIRATCGPSTVVVAFECTVCWFIHNVFEEWVDLSVVSCCSFSPSTHAKRLFASTLWKLQVAFEFCQTNLCTFLKAMLINILNLCQKLFQVHTSREL